MEDLDHSSASSSKALAIPDEPANSSDSTEGQNEGDVKRIKVSQHEEAYIQNLPSCEAYEKSYMHREVITHVIVTKTQFLITASIDGVIKFWKKTGSGIVFVKNFKSHLSAIEDMSVTSSGSELASVSMKDKSVKIFDVLNFDMINMFSLPFEPKAIEWIHPASTGVEDLIISDSRTSNIYVFGAKQSNNDPKRIINNVHTDVVTRMRFNPIYKTVVSCDKNGKVKYWRPNISNNTTPKVMNTTLTGYEETKLHNISFSSDGEFVATTSADRRIRVFKFRSGKLLRAYEETLEKLEESQRSEPMMNNMDFARRMAIEREMDRNSITSQENVIFDESGNFILFPTMLGVKIYNWKTNRMIKSLGREETNFRPLSISLFQGLIFDKFIRRLNIESLDAGIIDPTLFCTTYKKNRFYCFSNRYFDEETTEGEGGELIKDRDIFNEKPSREEVMAAIEIEQQEKQAKQYENATIHTTMGDIHLKLFPNLAPKTCENFCTHSKNNYYNNHIFHRVIKQFMIQTGDPTGTGSGGESIWDDDFEDEFCSELRHDKPFTLSMANCGPNTNGSQFFITVAPCTELDNKHTVFGRVTQGMDVCLNISKVKTDPKTDKPYKDIKILNIKVF